MGSFNEQLCFEPLTYIERELKKQRFAHLFNKSIFIILNVLTLLIAATLASLVPFFVAKINWKSYPYWYLIVAAGVTAVTALSNSLISFFYIREKYIMARKNRNFILAEMIKFQTNDYEYEKVKNKEFLLYKKIVSKLGHK